MIISTFLAGICFSLALFKGWPILSLLACVFYILAEIRYSRLKERMENIELATGKLIMHVKKPDKEEDE